MNALRLKILLCVDDPALGAPLRDALARGPFLLREVETGLEVAIHAQRDEPDLILVSASAPLLPGADLARRLKTHPKTRNVPTLFLCGAPGDAQALVQAGVPSDRCFRAPVDMAQLLGRIQAVLMRHSIAASAGRASHLDGNIAKVPLAHLLMTLETTSPSGVLRIRNPQREGYILFKDGHVLNGYADDLEGEDALLALFECDSGTFSFVQMDMTIQATALGKPSTLILECLRLLDDKNALAPFIPRGEEILTRPSAQQAPAPALDEELEKLLKEIDGKRSVDEIVRMSGPFRTRSLLALARLVEGGLAVRDGESPAPDGKTATLVIVAEEIERLARGLAAERADPRGHERGRIAVFLACTRPSLSRSLREMVGDRLEGTPEGPVGRGRWALALTPELGIEFIEVSPGNYPAVADEVRVRLGAAVYLFSGLSIPDIGGARHFIRWARTWAPGMPVLLATYELDPDSGFSLWEIQSHVDKEERVYFLPFRSFGRTEMGLLVTAAIGRLADGVENRVRGPSGVTGGRA